VTSDAAAPKALPTESASPKALADSRIGLLLLSGLTFFWGVNWPAMKTVVGEMPVFTFRAITVIVGAAGLMLIARLAGQRLWLKRSELRPLLVVSLINVTAWQLLSAFALVNMPAGRAAIVAYTMPVWTAILAVLVLHEKLTRRIVFALVFGMAGIACLLIPARHQFASAGLGILLMATGGFTWASGTIALKRVRWDLSITALAGWQMLIGGIPIVIAAFVVDRSFEPSSVSTTAWLACAYAVVIPTIFCHWAWYRVVSIYPASISALGTLLIPVVGVLSSTLALGEPIGWDVIAALVLVGSAIVLIALPTVRKR
jgi:drug/metabolite transporter (DMT)-like permease